MGAVEDGLLFTIQTLIVMLLCNIVIFRIIRNLLYSTVITVLKFIFFYTYFIYFVEIIPFNLTDDLNYYFNSIRLYEMYNGDMSTAFSTYGFAKAASVAGGFHFGYYIFNVIAFDIFGLYYYAPILFNIPLSVFTAVFIYKTLLLAKIDEKKAKMFFVFFLLHWDLLTWQSIFNLKDTMVLFMTSACIYNITYLKVRGVNFFNILGILLILVAFAIIRFYYSYLLIGVMVVYYLSSILTYIRTRWLGLVFRCLIFIVLPIGFYFVFMSLFGSSPGGGLTSRTNPLIGGVRYLITPFPLKVSSGYTFLIVAATIHWITLPFMMYGLYIVIKRHLTGLLPWLILFVIVTIFYGSFNELQGPRHRIPMVGIISILQFMGLYEFFVNLKPLQNRKEGAVRTIGDLENQ